VPKQNLETPELGRTLVLQPRVVRFKDAFGYLGMDRDRFKFEVRPYVTEIPIGTQGIAFDRLDLDAWFDQYRLRNGRPGSKPKGEATWDAKERRASSSVAVSGTLTSKFEEADFAKALGQATSRKRKRRCTRDRVGRFASSLRQ
jgi:hypothetical protein